MTTNRKTREIGPYSRRTTLAKLDRRTREARLMEEVRDELVKHVGGSPSATQAALIERAVWLSLHIAMMDARIADAGAMTDCDSRTYLAWSNTLARTLAHLGLQAVPTKAPSLADHLAARAAQLNNGAAEARS